ncbi:MAG: AAA family ATPase, partial [Sedimenticolaceae bacterium]
MALVGKPTSLKETGLSQWTLADLACKHLAEAGVLDLGEIAQRLKLPGAVIEELLLFLRAEGRVELRSRRDHNAMLRFGLTDAGRRTALDALQKDGYVGPAPITLE